MEPSKDTLLTIEELSVAFNTPDGCVQAVRGISLQVARGKVVAIVGESGCGKSVTCQAIMGLNPPAPFTTVSGSIIFDGQELLTRTELELERLRGGRIGMIFQNPMTSLNPTMTIGKQVMEGIFLHHRCSTADAHDQALALLEKVGISDAQQRFGQYPHQFSGGMRQRVMIAIALSGNPDVIIADEPTTALDVTIQAQILELLRSLQKETEMSVILVTHDLAVVSGFADRLVIVYAGKIVEEGDSSQLLSNPQHPYTQALIKALPQLGQDRSQPLATIDGRPPNLMDPPSGCPFWPRCPYAMRICQEQLPEVTVVDTDHNARCWLHHPLAVHKKVSNV
ncbi:Dipeptide transport ATP-binding protein DppD [Chlamydiales bacterium SCGC AG-110-P3]|nr:Dipeptide transport ATP-binding protein DppD [Chlamydiales bacterium SCGC AG-110-P3]